MPLEDQSTFRLSQKSILDFLDSTGLPLMSRLTVVWRRLALVLVLGAMVGLFFHLRQRRFSA